MPCVSTGLLRRQVLYSIHHQVACPHSNTTLATDVRLVSLFTDARKCCTVIISVLCHILEVTPTRDGDGMGLG